MSERVVILDDYGRVALTMADWSPVEARAEVLAIADHLTGEALAEALRGASVVVAMREQTAFPRVLLEQLPDLRLLVTTGGRNAVVDEEACRDLGIVRSGTGGERYGTVELTWALILGSARHLCREHASVREGGWQVSIGSDLYGTTLGCCGLGHIGSAVARVGRAFGMRVLAWSENLSEERCHAVGAERVTKDVLLASSDVLTIHLVLSERTRGLIGEDELRQMKPGALLVNTSRGPICDEAALLRACTERWIAGAAVDVFEAEPLPPDHPFRRHPRVLTTPHVGFATERNYRIFFREAVEDIVAHFEGHAIRLVT